MLNMSKDTEEFYVAECNRGGGINELIRLSPSGYHALRGRAIKLGLVLPPKKRVPHSHLFKAQGAEIVEEISAATDIFTLAMRNACIYRFRRARSTGRKQVQ